MMYLSKQALSTIEELSECSASVQVPAEDVNLLQVRTFHRFYHQGALLTGSQQGDFTSLAGLSTRLVVSCHLLPYF
jgi:hypothetical protein